MGGNGVVEYECPYCGYRWHPRDTSRFHPVACPRCKRYLDVGRKENNKKGGESKWIN